jgi:acetyl esterase
MSKPTPPAALDPDVSRLLDRWAALPPLPAEELTAARVRADDLQVLELQRRPPRLHSVEDLELPGPAGPLPVRVYRPLAGELQPLLYLHGGGFVIGREGYEAPLRELASATGCLVVAPEQRLAPEHPFPAAVEDAVAAAWWLSERAPSLGASRAAPGICGDSSGGNLAAIVSHALCRGGARPSFQALIYPMLDATAGSASYREFATGFGFSAERSRWYFDRYLPRAIDRRAPSVSPLFELNVRELPPTLVVTAGFDPLRDEGERYAAALRAAGVDTTLSRYPGAIHGFFQLTGALEASRRVHAELGRWIRVRSRQAATPARNAAA